MPYLIAFGSLFGIAAAWFLWLYVDIRRRKDDRIQLRLLVGRSRLLQEEIDRRIEALALLDPEILATTRQQAQSALNELQILLVERQAHLQDREELGHLQHTKITLLEKQVQSLAQGAVAGNSQGKEKTARPVTAESTAPRNRNTIERQLLNKIGIIQDKARKPPS
jgi:hypothetical protein